MVGLLSLMVGVSGASAQGFGPEITVGSGFTGPIGVTVDGAGHAFIADSVNNRVVEVTLSNGQQQTIASDFDFPEAVAVDGAGHLFVADSLDNRVVEITLSNGQQQTIGSGLNDPTGVTVDGAGHAFVADYGNNRVVEITLSNGQLQTIDTAVSQPAGVAVDGAGHVFIADAGNNRVQELTLSNGQVQTVVSGLNFPTGVALDAAGNLFVADAFNHRVAEVINGQVQTIASNFTLPTGLALDNGGDLFVADQGANQVVEFLASPNPITWAQQGPYSYGQAVALNATAPGGAVSYTVKSGPCTVAGSTMTSTGVGQCVIDANQVGGSGYAPASQVEQTITIGPAATMLVAAQAKRGLLTITFSATLTSKVTTLGIGGQHVTFSWLGHTFCQGTTNGSGVASCTVASLVITLGDTSYTASYAGSANYQASTATGVIEEGL